MPEEDPLARLVADGLLRRDEARVRTGPRWQAAMARAALHLQRAGAAWGDLRLPIAAALAEIYRDLPDEEIAHYVEVMLPIEQAELAPLFGASRGAR